MQTALAVDVHWDAVKFQALQTVHGVMVEVDGEGQKLPAGHAAHLVLAVTLHAETVYWPGLQASQVLHAAALVVVE